MLSERSKQVRRDTLALSKANGGYHYGGSFSATEILIALYDEVMTEDDKFILSKGHACWPLYVLLREKGLNPRLTGHPTRDPHNGIHCSTGSLGHGLPTAIGMAMAKKIKGEPGRIFVLLGDGECQEGTTWESLLIAAHNNLDNLTVIVDWNSIQGSGKVEDVMPIPDIDEIAFQMGWDTETIDGHNITAIAEATPTSSVMPQLIVASTTKGKGISFMEDKPEWHAKWPNPEEEAKILEELQ